MKNYLSIPILGLLVCGCSVTGSLQRRHAGAALAHTPKVMRHEARREQAPPQYIEIRHADGRPTEFFVPAVTLENGEQAMMMELDEVVVTARTRSLPERMGKVDIDFVVTLPKMLQGSCRNIVVTPVLYNRGERTPLEDISIRGALFDRVQQRDYWQYGRYIDLYRPDSLRAQEAFDRFVRFLEEHPGETLLVHMKYENTSTNANKRGWNKSVVSYIKSRCNGRIADFTPRMTLADARGKILFVIREDYKSDNGGEYLGAYLNWTNDKVVFETTLHGNTGEAAPIKVNDLYNIKNGASDGVSKYAAIDECIAYTYNTDDPTRWCMNYVSCYDTAHCSVSGISLFGAVGDYDYCANKYNRYTADKIDRYDFRGNVGIVLMDFAAASHATMTYGQTYSNMQVYGDDLVRAVICNNNKWNLRRNE